MKKAFVGAAILCAALSVVAAATPDIAVDYLEYNAGTVIAGSSIQHTFVLTNTGTSTLTISDIGVSCGCTATRLADTSLDPGESVELAAVVAVSGTGTYSKHIYVYSNDPNTPKLTLDVRYTAVAALPYTVTAEELEYWYYYLIDIRDPAEYAAYHLVNAVNIPAAELVTASVGFPKDKLIVIYDESGGDTADPLAQQLNAAGYSTRSLWRGLEYYVSQFGSLGIVFGPGTNAADLTSNPHHDVGSAFRDSYHIAPYRLFPLYVLVDVRNAEAYSAQHFVGALNIPYSEIPSWYDVLPNSTADGLEIYLVLYDGSGSASDAAASMLVDRGFDLARSLFGGLAEWMVQYGTQWIVSAD